MYVLCKLLLLNAARNKRTYFMNKMVLFEHITIFFLFGGEMIYFVFKLMRVALHWGHSLAEQHIDDRTSHCQ